MKQLLRLAILGLVCLVVFINSCKKSASEFNFNTAVTATFGGTTQQYVAPSGLVYTTTDYLISGYEASAGTNTIAVQINDSISGSYPMTGGGNGNYVQIVNNGTTYTSTRNGGASAGMINITIKGSAVTGSFSGTLYNVASTQDSLVVTNGTISTSY